MREKVKILTWVPAIIVMVMIYRFSASTGKESSNLSLGITQDVLEMITNVTNQEMTLEEQQKIIEKIHTPIRKLGHITEYAALGFMYAIPLYVYHKKRKSNLILTSELLLLLYAALDECHQLFVSERSGRVTDVLIDGIGGIVGILCFYLLIYIINKLGKKSPQMSVNSN